MMWIARYQKYDRMWSVGYEDAQGEFHAIRDCADENEASEHIHYLNGGTKASMDVISEQLAEIKALLLELLKGKEADRVTR